MKHKTYNILSRVPIIGTVVKCCICDPTIYCSPFKETELYKLINEYGKKHPDEQITRKVIKSIIKENKGKN